MFVFPIICNAQIEGLKLSEQQVKVIYSFLDKTIRLSLSVLNREEHKSFSSIANSEMKLILDVIEPIEIKNLVRQ